MFTSDLDATLTDRLRGHAFYPSDDVLATIPGLYETENVRLDDKVLHLHYFVGGCDWYIAELDSATGEAFGWAQTIPGCGEWGYISLPALATVRAEALGMTLPVERDLHFTPTVARVALARFDD